MLCVHLWHWNENILTVGYYFKFGSFEVILVVMILSKRKFNILDK